ncbi:MAG: DNRLRE domain-containing protein, partial [Gammaproteobacteria bacterium]
MKYQTGIALLPVALIITVIAAVSLLLSYESSMNVHQSASQNESKQADLIAEAGMAHAKWQLKKITDCAGYANLPSTNFDVHSYTANITPDNGSPISVSATGVSNTGITRTLIDTHMRMYQTPYTKEFVLDESGKDTFIEGESGHTDHNKGNDNHIVIKSETNKPERGLIQFDLTKIPSNTKILNAILELHLSDSKGSSQDIFIHRVTDDWVEEEVTWEIKRSGFFQNWSPQGGEYVAQVSGLFSADSVGWKSAEITQLVQDWVKAPSINNGMILLSMPASGNNEKIFTSSDQGDVALHPKLTITYACECGQQCLDPAVSKLLLIVSDPNNLDPQEEARQSLFESWGYGVALIDDSKSQEDLEDAAALNNVIYVSEEIDHDQLRDKLRGVPIGIVNEEQYLFQEFGFSNDRSIKFRDQIDIVDNSHYITSTFPQGLLTVYTSEQPSSMVITPASGVRVLGLLNNSGPGWEPSLAVIDTGGELYGGGVAPARRVKLPWANIDVSTLNEDGQTLTRRAIEWAAGAEGEDNNTGLIAHWKLDETTGLVAK